MKHSTDNCYLVADVIFVKTHKTASSTIQNILFRFGTKHNLVFALPAHNGNRFNYPRPFNLDMVKKIDAPVNIITNHLRASDELRKVNSKAKMVTIVRSTASLYESTFSLGWETVSLLFRERFCPRRFPSCIQLYENTNPGIQKCRKSGGFLRLARKVL